MNQSESNKAVTWGLDWALVRRSENDSNPERNPNNEAIARRAIGTHPAQSLRMDNSKGIPISSDQYRPPATSLLCFGSGLVGL